MVFEVRILDALHVGIEIRFLVALQLLLAHSVPLGLKHAIKLDCLLPFLALALFKGG